MPDSRRVSVRTPDTKGPLGIDSKNTSRTQMLLESHFDSGCMVDWPVALAVEELTRVPVKGNYKAPPRPRWGRGIHVSPQ